MKILFGLFLSLVLSSQSFAAEELKAPVEVITRKVEKTILPLPECGDKKLLEKTKEYISDYFEKNKSGSSKFRRRRHFILHNLADFGAENIANYQTDATRSISNIIIDVKINKGILQENMRLCKNNSRIEDPSQIYLLIHPENNGYRVYVLNLQAPNTPLDKLSFFYE